MNEQEKKVSSVKALFKDFSYSTFLHYVCPLNKFSLQLLYHQSSPSHLGFILLHFSTKKKKKEFDTFYYIPFIFVVIILLLVWFCFAPVLWKKKICKEWDFPVLNFRCSLLCYYPLVLVLLCSTSPKTKEKELRIFSLSVLSPLLSFTTIATIPDLQSQRSRRENC